MKQLGKIYVQIFNFTGDDITIETQQPFVASPTGIDICEQSSLVFSVQAPDGGFTIGMFLSSTPPYDYHHNYGVQFGLGLGHTYLGY